MENRESATKPARRNSPPCFEPTIAVFALLLCRVWASDMKLTWIFIGANNWETMTTGFPYEKLAPDGSGQYYKVRIKHELNSFYQVLLFYSLAACNCRHLKG